MKKYILFLFLAITALSLFVRFWNYKYLVGFTLDAPLHLFGAKAMVDSGKIGLLGPSVTSKEVLGRVIFLGPFYYYVLAILGIVSHWNVIFISAFLTCLWPAAFIILFFWLNKKFGGLIAILIYTLLSFYPLFIQVSRQIWNPQFIPLFGALFFVCLAERKKSINYFLAGIFWGMGLNIHYSTALWGLIVAAYVTYEIYKKQFHLKNWLLLILGLVIAEAPLIVFELRHNFYNLNTILFHFEYGGMSQGYTFNIWYYYVLPFLAPASYLVGKFLYSIRKTKIYSSVVIVLFLFSIYLIVLAIGPQGQKAAHPLGWSIANQQKVVSLIIKDNEKSYEVAETISSDTRAMDIRWWLAQSGKNVMDVDQYDKAPVLYLVAADNRPPESETVWEVSSLKPFKIDYKLEIDKGLFLYKLLRI